MRRAQALFVAALAVSTAVVMVRGPLAPDPPPAGVAVPAGAPLPLSANPDPDEPEGDLSGPPVALAPPGGAIVQPGVIRLPRPKLDPNGQRRVGIQVGHWQTDDVPKEYGTRITAQTGTSWAGYTEVEVNRQIAERIARLLRAQGLAVDLLPTTVPEGYLADAFIALHADGDGVGELSGFKLAHGTRRGPYEDSLLGAIKDVYRNATGLDYDSAHISRNMLFYYSFNWSRYKHAASPFTPAVIIEMGFLSNDDDRDLLVARQDVIAKAIVDGVLRFLDEHPRATLFAEDLLIPAAPVRPGPIAVPSASP